MTGEEVVRYAVDDGVATVTLDSPANRNALSTTLVAGLTAALTRAADDPAVRAVLLTHTGTTFCAGADLREALETGADAGLAEAAARRLVALLRAIVAHPTPVVARIDGHTRAGGVGLVAACDVAVAGPASSFAVTEARLGLAPAVISAVLLPRLTSRAAARAVLTGETFGAVEAERAGLVTLAADNVRATTEAVLASIRLGSPQGLAESKRLLAAPMLEALDARGEELAVLSARLFCSTEARAAMAAFTERRGRPATPSGPAAPAAAAGPG